MKKEKSMQGFSILGLLIVLAVIAILSYVYLKPSTEKPTKQQAPKTQIQLDQLKQNLNQQVQNSQHNKALEDL